MCGGGAQVRDLFWCCFCPLKIILESLRIFLRNKRVFFSIFFFGAIPLSSLIFSACLTTHPLRSEIYHLEAVALLAPTRFEARHVWKESRDDAISLLRIKALFAIPCFVLSLVTAIAAVHSTALSYSGKAPTLRAAANAVKQNWKRPSITTIFIYAILLAFAALPRALAVLAPLPELRFVVMAAGSGAEVYLMALLSVGLVVSITEERFGWEAIQLGSDLMEGRRFCGWMLAGLLLVVSGLIRWKMEILLGGPISSSEFLPAIGVPGKIAIICTYGMAVLWSYMVTTVFYCDSKRRHGIREDEGGYADEGVSML